MSKLVLFNFLTLLFTPSFCLALQNSYRSEFPDPIISVGVDPRSHVSGDFDGDGRIDIAVSCLTGVNVLTNFGDLLYNVSEYSNDNWPFDIAAGDLDADGFLDLVTSNRNHDTVSIFLNRKDGTFESAGVVSTGEEPMQIQLIDMDSDLDLDFAIVDRDEKGFRQVKFFLNDGFGTFSEGDSYGFLDSGTNVFSICVVDFNLDDHIDVIAGGSGGEIGVLVNQGDGLFQFEPLVDVGKNGVVQSLVSADLDHDSDVDLVALLPVEDKLFVVINDGKGNLEVKQSFDSSAFSFSLGDLDKDGNIDFATGSTFGGVSWFFNDGSANFAESECEAFTGELPTSILLDDLDGDGDIDVSTTNLNSGDISVLRNENGRFVSRKRVQCASSSLNNFTSGDLNGDGYDDIVQFSFGSNFIHILTNEGSGQFCNTQSCTLNDGVGSISLGDIDNDQDLDIVATFRVDDLAQILINDGGLFSTEAVYMTGSRPIEIAMADFDLDGWLDVVIANSSSDNVSILHNSGDGTIESAALYSVGDGPDDITVGDIDGDGDLDVAIANQNSNDISILENDGNGIFGLERRISSFINIVSLAFGDMDDDLDLDIVVSSTNASGELVTVLNNDGIGEFAKSFEISVEITGLGQPIIADIDLDSDNEIIFGGTILGLNGKPLSEPQYFRRHSRYCIGDFDNDSDIDIVGRGFTSASFARPAIVPNKLVLLGDVNLDRELNLLDIVPFVESILSVFYLSEADVNGDGFVDLLDIDPFVSLLSQ